ncbi:unnamed protein product [Paramecium pentaurelia]|uniref:FHA domain-containing protein n=1 Tax=Paramecium pentaurelia TaxID=43138 RepID=A0A8S1SJ71_9CILI|nr:unnamed protein product [Paramecium pentaurelia]
MSYQLYPKPFHFYYYLPYPRQLAIPMIPPYNLNNYPQQFGSFYNQPIIGNSSDNCIVIEDDNIQHPLNPNQQSIIQTQTNREQTTQQEQLMILEQPLEKQMQQYDKLNENEPHIRISVFKQHSTQIDAEYILQYDRILGNQYKNEIIIGRKKLQDDKSENCDIQLPHGDKNVEKVHCKLSTEKGFSYSNLLTKSVLLFFSLFKSNKYAMKLPFSVKQHIYSFIKDKPQFYLTDNATKTGTFLKIKKDNYKIMQLHNTYLIGADTYFHIMEIKSKPTQIKYKKNKDLNQFYNALAKEHIRKGVKIHGLTLEESEQLNVLINEFRTNNLTQRAPHKLSQYDRPYLKFAFNSPSINQIQSHIFIAKYDQESVFKIGRSQECDVIININTVSRRQAQIIYKNNEWYIHDGEGVRESANGTWQSLQNYSTKNHEKKIQSKPRLIEDQMEIKISENIIKFDFVNFGVTKKRKLNQALIQDLLW